MEIRLGANTRSSPVAGCDGVCDNAEIHKNLSPFRLRWDATPGQVGLRFFLAQERMFLAQRIHWIRLRSEILFELSKIFRRERSRSAPNAVTRQRATCEFLEVPLRFYFQNRINSAGYNNRHSMRFICVCLSRKRNESVDQTPKMPDITAKGRTRALNSLTS